MKQKLAWRGVVVASGAASAVLVRQGARVLWRARRHEDPPTDPGARDIPWRDALIWSVSLAVGVAVARVVAVRTAARVWTSATGSEPPAES